MYNLKQRKLVKIMVQNLSKKELNDVVDVMLYTKMNHSSHKLLRKQNIKYMILLGIIFYFGFVSTLKTSENLSKFALLLAVICFSLAVYVWFYASGLKKNVRKMIESRIGVPIEVTISKNYVRYNGTNIPWAKIEKIIEYKNLYFCVFGKNFIVLQPQPELNNIIELEKDGKYMRYNQPFTLF